MAPHTIEPHRQGADGVDFATNCGQEYKLYSFTQVILLSFLLGPLPGICLMARNFKNMGRRTAYRMTLSVGLPVFLLIMLSLVIFAPSLYALSYTCAIAGFAIVTAIAWKSQKAEIDHHTEQGKAIYSWGRAIGASLLAILCAFVVLFVLLLGIVTLFPQTTAII